MKRDTASCIRRIAFSLELPISTVGRWLGPVKTTSLKVRARPVSNDPTFRVKVKELCEEDRHEKYGHRRIRAHLMRRFGIRATRKTVLRAMREQDLSQPKLRFKTSRPKRVKKTQPPAPNRGWQIDMTSFSLPRKASGESTLDIARRMTMPLWSGSSAQSRKKRFGSMRATAGPRRTRPSKNMSISITRNGFTRRSITERRRKLKRRSVL